MTAALVVLALLLAGALALGQARRRDRCLAAAALLVPVLLVAHIEDTSAFQSLVDRPAVLAALAAGGLVAVAALAALFVRVPSALPLAVVATLPFRIPIAVGGSTANLLVPLYVVVGAGVLAHLWSRMRTEEERPALPPGWLERVLAVVLVLYAAQATYSDDVDRAVENVVFFYAPFTLLFLLLSRAVDWTRRLAVQCLGVLVGLALLFAGIGFVEYATRTLLLNPKVISSNPFEEYFRVNSLFFDPNIYGRFLALVMLAVATVLLWTARPRVVLGAAVVLALLWAGLVLTFSQSSFTALVVGLAILAGLRWNPRLALGAVAALAVVGAAVVLVAPGAINLDTGSGEGLDNATSGRYDLVAGGGRLASAKPVGGWGSGSFARAFRREETASEQQAASASHTIPVTVAAEQGVPGLLAYLALLVLAFARLARGARRDPVRGFVLAAFAALVVHTLLYASFLEDPLTWALLAVGTALAPRVP
jgi:putative inorganic carbon (HCO3(-)) transporter